ncbi:MAG: hypothetical protein KF873_16985 [Gemmataceae bacterium]|nr:hypothetical protein [Planctomycetia bacterium]MBX3400431.1 hypothetical protein [Gemmataceae bacterium]
MPMTIHCRCGRELAIARGRIDCPSCGRCHVVLGEGRALPLALAAAAAFAVVAVGLLGALIGSTRPAPAPVAVLPGPEIPPAPVIEPELVPPPPPKLVPAPEPMPVPVPPPPEPPPSPMPRAGALEAAVEPPGRYKVGDVIQQTVLVSRRSKYTVAGVDLASSSDYRLESSIVIAKVHADGSLAATQTIAAAKLLDADRDSKAGLAAALEKAQGRKFGIAIAADGSATAIEGWDDPIRVERKDDDPTRSFRLSALVDADGWKELAGLTFFQPGAPLKPKSTWANPTAHEWGPLGRWSGRTVFASVGRAAGRGALERIDFRHDLSHAPPAAGADGALPIRIAKAEFRTIAAGGAILYDPVTARTVSADELFHVRGSLAVALDGLIAPVTVEERQSFQLVVGEGKEQELFGRPPALRKE